MVKDKKWVTIRAEEMDQSEMLRIKRILPFSVTSSLCLSKKMEFHVSIMIERMV